MTSPSDTSLVERLRDTAKTFAREDPSPNSPAESYVEWEAADRIEALEARVRELEAGLREAAEAIECWGAYASPYFQEKHDLDGDVVAARSLLPSPTGDQE